MFSTLIAIFTAWKYDILTDETISHHVIIISKRNLSPNILNLVNNGGLTMGESATKINSLQVLIGDNYIIRLVDNMIGNIKINIFFNFS